ncbi:MAG: aldehyde dehydrogenase [Streptosporangiaceae bacterium]
MTAATEASVRSFDRLFVGGRWVVPSSDRTIEVISPATEKVIAYVAEAQEADIDAAVAAARTAFDDGPWPHWTPAERAAALRRIKAEIAKRIPAMSRSFSLEIGAPLAVSEAFHQGALVMWESAADVLERYDFEERRPSDVGTARLRHEPVGVVGTITPWNAPVGNGSIKLAPALAAGCTAVLKPAPEGPSSAMLLAEAFEAADLPEGVVSVLPAGREVGEHLVRHPDVDKVAFTGSTAAGKRIMSLCGERIARVTLELGGKSAGIIADDIFIDEELPELVMAGLGHSGQVCAALTRILVPRRRQDEIAEKIADIMRGIDVGDPMNRETQLGPLAMERQRERVETYVRAGIDEGATLVVGGGRPPDLARGWYFEPTLFVDVHNSMRIAQEEIFGPVLCLIPFDDEEGAVSIANDSPYGLSGAVYASDLDLAERIASRVRTGQMWINGWGMCVTEPFGGFKQSGLGREGGVEGMSAYLETKYIWRA